MKNITVLLAPVLLTLFIAGCKSDYEQMVDKELAKGIRNDSIFFGLHLGMNKDSFYNYCWDMNKKGIFNHGTENEEISVFYPIMTFKDPINMNFFPEFHDNNIFRMWALFRYRDWAPWNQEFNSARLHTDIMQLAEKWYGTGFKEMHSPNGKPFWLKIEANRQILITIPSEKYVRMEITDLASPAAFRKTDSQK